MFDVGFSELVLILVVGLLVFGPEKLPEVVRTTSLWISKIRRSFMQIRSEIEREVGVDEIKREIHNQSILDSLKEVRNDLQRTQQDLQHLPHDVRDAVNRPYPPEHVVPDDDLRHNDTFGHNDGFRPNETGTIDTPPPLSGEPGATDT